MKLSFCRTVLAAVLVMPALLSTPVLGQGKRGGGMNRRPSIRPERPQRERPLEKFQKMTPEQRQKALQHVTPERRKAIEDRLREYDALPPAERARLKQQLDTFRSLPPERQEAVRKAANGFNKLAPERQQAVREELRQMSGLSESEREARLHSDEFRGRFKKHEQKLIEELHNVVPQ